MKILPVIDLLANQVVRGISGQRECYMPIESRLTPGSEPIDIARAFVEYFQLTEVYIADLDAIAGSEPSWKIYQQMADSGLDLWIDAGISQPEQVSRLADFQAAGRLLTGLIVGLESVDSPEILEKICRQGDSRRIVFSLDLKNARLLNSSPAWEGFSPEQVIQIIAEQGVDRVIVLDLARVGMSQGTGTEELCRSLKKLHPEIRIISGGGINSLNDLRLLADSGCCGALIASSLHDGRLTYDEIRIAQKY